VEDIVAFEHAVGTVQDSKEWSALLEWRNEFKAEHFKNR